MSLVETGNYRVVVGRARNVYNIKKGEKDKSLVDERAQQRGI